VIETTQIGGRRSDRLMAGKLSPGDFGLLQQYRHWAAEPGRLLSRRVSEDNRTIFEHMEIWQRVIFRAAWHSSSS
jgi:hypothetical protein